MAASGASGKNTQAEALRSVLANIADMKTFPDADLPYLIQLESQILTKLREPFAAMQQQAYGPQPGAPGAGPQMPGAGGMGVAPAPGGGVPGLQNGAPLPPMDELRRVLSEQR